MCEFYLGIFDYLCLCTSKKLFLMMEFKVLWKRAAQIVSQRRKYLGPLEFHQHVGKPGLNSSLGLFLVNRRPRAGRVMVLQGHSCPSPWGLWPLANVVKGVNTAYELQLLLS